VAINAPLSRLFDYLPPESGLPEPGCRIQVPFGRQVQTGLVMEIAAHSEVPAARLKHAMRTIDASTLLNEADRWLIQFTSSYYHHPIGEVVAAALPTLLRQGNPLTAVVRKVAVTAVGASADIDAIRKRAPRQAQLLLLLQDAQIMSFAELDEAMPGWRRVKKSLIEKSLLEEFTTSNDSDDMESFANVEQVEGPALNADQKAALQSIRAQDGFRVSLLDGVTGSGKTEVYLHLIQDQINAGKQVLVIVPEIGLTPQLVDRFQKRLGLEPVLMHSGLTDTARLTAWRAARSGRAQLIVGTRSAIFASLQEPGLIIVDEEHDSSLKQQEGLRYSARDLAVVRGKHLDIPVVLGTATPSLESLQRCREDAYHRSEPTFGGRWP
jgi:primosomal protein N' (replication factor Y)